MADMHDARKSSPNLFVEDVESGGLGGGEQSESGFCFLCSTEGLGTQPPVGSRGIVLLGGVVKGPPENFRIVTVSHI